MFALGAFLFQRKVITLRISQRKEWLYSLFDSDIVYSKSKLN